MHAALRGLGLRTLAIVDPGVSVADYPAYRTLRDRRLLLERGDGHYLITSSVAGRRALPGSLYSATKFAATAIGEALRLELRQMHGENSIKVTLIEPGMTDTPFFDDSPGEDALRDEDIAGAVLYALEQGPNVDVNEILVRPTAQDT